MTEPLTHARIGYDTIARRGTVAGSGAAGFPASAAANELTYSYWKASALPATWEVQADNEELVNYLGIAAHEINSKGATAVLQAYINGEWAPVPFALAPPQGELWPFDAGLLSERNAAPDSGTSGSLMPGVAADGAEVIDFVTEVRESRFGRHSLVANPFTFNAFNTLTRTSQTGGFAIDFGTPTIAADTEHHVHGTQSLKVTFGDAGDSVKTTAVAPLEDTPYTFSCWVKVVGDDVGIQVFDDVSIFTWEAPVTVSDTGGKWVRVVLSGTTNTGAADVRAYFTSDGESIAYIDGCTLAEDATEPRTWVDGSRASETLNYDASFLHGVDDLTVAFWVRGPETVASATRVALYMRQLDTPLHRLGVDRLDTDDFLTIRVGTEAGVQLVETSAVFDGEWHHVALVSHGSGSLQVYIDGVLDSTNAIPCPSPSKLGLIDVCQDQASGHWYGFHRLDDLLVVNYAATAVQVAAWAQQALTLALAGLPPVDDRPIVRLYEATTGTRFRVRVTGDEPPAIGVVFIGRALEMPRPIYGGHTPISLARQTVIRPSVSERGQWLGRSIVRSGSRGSWTWRNFKAAWYRLYFEPFVELARRFPFFILWRPESFPDEAGYVWTQGDIAPTNTGVRDLMEVTVDAEGLGVD